MKSGNSKTKTGVILAAGFGSRLAGTQEATDLKPLTPINGTPLIYRTINSLEKAGCNRVVIVLGYGYEEVKSEIEDYYEGSTPVEFAHNEKYDLQNGVSVLAAEPFIENQFILTMADHILSDKMMRIAGTHVPPEKGATLMVDYKLDSIFDMDDATKVKSMDGKISSIGKQISDYNCIDTGVFICTTGLLDEIRKVYEEQGDASLSDGVQALAETGRMHTLDIGDAFWQDVDTPEMLEHAEKVLASQKHS